MPRDKESFKDIRKLKDRNFGFGLRRYGITEPGIDTPEMAMYIDEEGYMNFGDKERLYLFQAQDPIDAPVAAEYSKENLFIEGLRKAIGGDLPVGAIILYAKNGAYFPPEQAPEGFGLCNSSLYRTGPGKNDTWLTPGLPAIGPAAYIQKLPEGAVLEREGMFTGVGIGN